MNSKQKLSPRAVIQQFFSFSGSGVLVALIVYVILISVIAPLVNSGAQFLTVSNLLTVLRQQAYIALMACGVTLVMITGGIDLSVGSANALLACICAWAAQFGAVMAVCVTLLAGALCGLVNGLLVGGMRFNAFITTLGTGSMFSALAVIFCTAVSGGYITPKPDPAFEFIGRGNLGPVPMPVIILLAVVVLCAVLLKRTTFGQQLYAIGANEKAAYYSGIPVRLNIIVSYVITGILCGLAATVMVSNIMSASPSATSGQEMDVVLAVVLGGTSIMGGRGSIWGTAVGFIFIGLLTTGFTFLSLNTYVQWVAMGVILVIALWLDARKERGRR